MATVTVTPSSALTAAVDALKGAITSLPPADQTYVMNAADDLVRVMADELNAVAETYLAKIPVFGGIADNIVKNAIATALDEGLAQLTAARATIATA